MTGVILFSPGALLAFKEICRVLKKGGRFVLFTGTKETRGTLATPEPIASRLHFYEDEELKELARNAGFTSVRVIHPDLGPFSSEAGLTEEQVSFFSGRASGSQLMIAVKE
jgi:SAM-dependent methyltransferase